MGAKLGILWGGCIWVVMAGIGCVSGGDEAEIEEIEVSAEALEVVPEDGNEVAEDDDGGAGDGWCGTRDHKCALHWQDCLDDGVDPDVCREKLDRCTQGLGVSWPRDQGSRRSCTSWISCWGTERYRCRVATGGDG